MSSRKSDNLALPLEYTEGTTSGWRESAIANVPVPLVILVVALLGGVLIERAVDAYYQRIIMLIGFNIILAVSLQLINGFSGQFSLGHAGFMAVGAYMAAYPAIEFSQQLTDPFASLWFYITTAVVAGIAGMLLLLLFWGLRATGRIHPILPMILLLLLLAWLLIDIAQAAKQLTRSPVFIWTELFTRLGSSFQWLLAAGEPMAAKLTTFLPETLRYPFCLLVLVLGGGACAGVVGLIVGMPALRLRGDYLAIATLGFAEIIRILIQNSEPLGGALGLTRIPKGTNFAWLYGFAIVTIVVIWRVAYSAKGRAIMAVREDEIAASATGIDTTHHKVMAFMIGSFFGGVAGALFALHERSITPSYYGLARSIEIVVMVTLGGLGSISGAILAAIVLTLLPEVLRPIADLRMVIYSLLLIVVMLLRPQGMLGGRECWPGRWRRS